MNTITAKELRDNLGSVAKRVHSGEHIVVSYRNQFTFLLQPSDSNTTRTPRKTGLDSILKAPLKQPISVDYKTRPIKEMYHEMLDKEYGVQ